MSTEVQHKELLYRLAVPMNNALYDQEDKIEIELANFTSYRGLVVEGHYLDGLSAEMRGFFACTKSWKVRWNTLPSLEFRLEGSINILPIEEIHKIGDAPFMPNDFPVMKGFRLLDYFYDEGAVGFYIDQPERGLFLFLFDADPQPLHIGFEGYLDLLVYTRGVSYWQNLILEHLTKQSYANVSKIREHLPKLFPDFSMEGFIERYESKRLT